MPRAKYKLLTEAAAWQKLSRRRVYTLGLCDAIEELADHGEIDGMTRLSMLGKVRIAVIVANLVRGEENSYIFPPGETERRQELARIIGSWVKVGLL